MDIQRNARINFNTCVHICTNTNSIIHMHTHSQILCIILCVEEQHREDKKPTSATMRSRFVTIGITGNGFTCRTPNSHITVWRDDYICANTCTYGQRGSSSDMVEIHCSHLNLYTEKKTFSYKYLYEYIHEYIINIHVNMYCIYMHSVYKCTY